MEWIIGAVPVGFFLPLILCAVAKSRIMRWSFPSVLAVWQGVRVLFAIFSPEGVIGLLEGEKGMTTFILGAGLLWGLICSAFAEGLARQKKKND